MYARSEAELEQIMDGLHEQEVNTGVSLVFVGISFLGLRKIHSLKKLILTLMTERLVLGSH